MKTACLILAYRAAPVLAGALPLMLDAHWDVFVHLDRKSNREEYLSRLGPSVSRCRFIEDPCDVFWGGYSMMVAEFKLIAAAQAAGGYDKYVLLSDDSFPILPATALAEHFNSPDEQINVVRQVENGNVLQRYRGFYYLDHPATAMQARGSGSVEIDIAFEQRIAEIAALRRIRKKPINLYFGSQFWGLTRSTIEFILRTIEDDVQLAKSFEYSALPDELMIQSIVGHYLLKRNHCLGPVWANFPLGVGPTVIRGFEDLPIAMDGRFAFVRKISPEAVAFVELMTRRLKEGKTIYGLKPGISHFEAVTYDEEERAWNNVCLSAPLSSPTSGWHGIEQDVNRRYRWSAAPEVAWELKSGCFFSRFVRFFIPIAMESYPGFGEQCCLEWRGLTRELVRCPEGFVASFDGFPATSGSSSMRVVLKTPRPVSPKELRGARDERALGLCVLVK